VYEAVNSDLVSELVQALGLVRDVDRDLREHAYDVFPSVVGAEKQQDHRVREQDEDVRLRAAAIATGTQCVSRIGGGYSLRSRRLSGLMPPVLSPAGSGLMHFPYSTAQHTYPGVRLPVAGDVRHSENRTCARLAGQAVRSRWTT